jgi:hypothetical protein
MYPVHFEHSLYWCISSTFWTYTILVLLINFVLLISLTSSFELYQEWHIFRNFYFFNFLALLAWPHWSVYTWQIFKKSSILLLNPPSSKDFWNFLASTRFEHCLLHDHVRLDAAVFWPFFVSFLFLDIDDFLELNFFKILNKKKSKILFNKYSSSYLRKSQIYWLINL